jgi:S-adenosyl-L-methionine hydrolase (adenosine-forming)
MLSKRCLSAIPADVRITLLTDFGTRDGYTGAMKGVISSIAPDAIIDDIAHDIDAGDVRAGAWALGAYWHRYPEGTVHIAVVDPGVGSARRALVARLDGRYVVAPDNGLITLALDDASDVAIREIPAPSADAAPTFHGRDVFAPIAAHLAAGTAFDHLGSLINDPLVIVFPTNSHSESGIAGSVIHVDRFGNIVTSIRPDTPANAVIRVADVTIPIGRTYSDAEPGTLIAVTGSRGYLEISLRDGNASRALGMKLGDEVILDTPT